MGHRKILHRLFASALKPDLHSQYDELIAGNLLVI